MFIVILSIKILGERRNNFFFGPNIVRNYVTEYREIALSLCTYTILPSNYSVCVGLCTLQQMREYRRWVCKTWLPWLPWQAETATFKCRQTVSKTRNFHQAHNYRDAVTLKFIYFHYYYYQLCLSMFLNTVKKKKKKNKKNKRKHEWNDYAK